MKNPFYKNLTTVTLEQWLPLMYIVSFAYIIVFMFFEIIILPLLTLLDLRSRGFDHDETFRQLVYQMIRRLHSC